jgi:capsular polysaccharide transport system ATP-binding protein
VARVYGADVRQVIEFVDDFAELGRYMDVPVGKYSTGMRGRLGFGLSMAVEFDCYLVDEITGVGDARFRARSNQLFAERRQRSGLIMVSHAIGTIKEHCDHCMVIYESDLIVFDSVDEGIDFYKKNF